MGSPCLPPLAPHAGLNPRIQKRVMAVAAAAARKAQKAARHASTKGRLLSETDAANFTTFEVEHILGQQDDPDQAEVVRVAAFAADGSEGSSARSSNGSGSSSKGSSSKHGKKRPPRGAVLVVSSQLESKAVLRAMAAAPGVSTAMQDRWITVAQQQVVAGEQCS